MKYHINENGEVSPCKAKIRCPFGGATGSENHFATKAEAVRAAEKLLQSKNPTYSVSKSNFNFSRKAEAIGEVLAEAGVTKLPWVNNDAEMIEKWFGGDRKKYDLFFRLSQSENLKNPTKKAIIKLSNRHPLTIVSDAKRIRKTRSSGSQVDIMDESLSLESSDLATPIF